MADGREIEADLHSAMVDIIGRHESGFVTKWVALVETVAPDGSRGVWTMTSDDVKAWDTLGLLQYGIDLQHRQIARDDDDG